MKNLIRRSIIVALKTAGPLMILVLAVWIIVGMGISVIVN